MSLGKSLKAWYESRMKYEWDRIGQLEYARDQGLEQGRTQGLEQGEEKGEEELRKQRGL